MVLVAAFGATAAATSSVGAQEASSPPRPGTGWITNTGLTGTSAAPEAGALVGIAPGSGSIGPAESTAAPAGGESVIGRDSRIRIRNTTRYPSRAIGLLTMRFGLLGFGRCTAWLIQPSFALTSGHCLHKGTGRPGDWASGLRFAPGRNGIFSAPYGQCGVRTMVVPIAWYQRKDSSHDFGLIQLNCRIGNQVGWLGWLSRPGLDDLDRQQVTVRGYPVNKPRSTMWSMTGRIHTGKRLRVFYSIDTGQGQSGSPVYAQLDPPGVDVLTGQPLGFGTYGLAVHSYGVGLAGAPCRCNAGVRITRDRVHLLADWIRELS